MQETDIFGVQNPEMDVLGFVSVMGALGEHYALALYLGTHGLYGFWGMHDAGPNLQPEQMLEVPELQASFEDRAFLRDRDREVIKKLGLKFRGQQAWPTFRSYRPGFAPWFLEAHEARFLTHALEQTLDVAPRFRENRQLLDPFNGEHYLVRVPSRQDGVLSWQDQIVPVPPPEPIRILIQRDEQVMAALKRLKPVRLTIQVDLFMMPITIGERGVRPYFPYMLLVVDTEGGHILGSDLLGPEPSLNDMLAGVPGKLAQRLAQIGVRPSVVDVRTDRLRQLLAPMANELGIQLEQSHVLPALDEAKTFLLQRF